MPRASKSTHQAQARDILHGLAKRFTSAQTYKMGGKRYSSAQLAAPFEAQLAAMEEIRLARIALAFALQKEATTARRVKAMTLVLRAAVENEFGWDVTVLADFGWKLPKKPGPKTVEGKLAGVKKRAATRLARGTKGRRQRAKIRGVVPE